MLVPIGAFVGGNPVVGLAVWATYGGLRLALLTVIAGVAVARNNIQTISARLLLARLWMEKRSRYIAMGAALTAAAAAL